MSTRYYDYGFIYDSAGPMMYPNIKYSTVYLIGLLNTKVTNSIFKIICPTIHFTQSSVGKLPIIINNIESVESYSDSNLSISRLDWDAHETSWDFQSNELVSFDREKYMDIMSDYADFNNLLIDIAPPHLNSLESRYELYKTKWETNFRRLHTNEEELNRLS